MELQLSRTASNVLSEFVAIIIDTAKIKLFLAENKASSKTSASLDTPLVYDINANFSHRYLEFFLQDDRTTVIIQIQRPWKASEMPLPLYK